MRYNDLVHLVPQERFCTGAKESNCNENGTPSTWSAGAHFTKLFDRISANSRERVYIQANSSHHDSIGESKSGVRLIPELDAFIVILQNSLPTIATADFMFQHLREDILSVEISNSHKQLAAESLDIGLDHT